VTEKALTAAQHAATVSTLIAVDAPCAPSATLACTPLTSAVVVVAIAIAAAAAIFSGRQGRRLRR
jgi:hypothetical protein